MRKRIDFIAVNEIALRNLPALLRRWLPEGRMEGPEYVVRNPRRDDRRPGSFKINTRAGRRVLYRLSDLLKWAEAQRFRTTSEEAA